MSVEVNRSSSLILIDSLKPYWVDGSDLLRSGQAGRLIDACHLLIWEISEPSSEVAAELTELIRTSQQSLVTEMG